ncbi:hypothetical protein AKO1_009762 [Acrasis kona]|uniref:V-type ATP synthase subunit atpI n=1 Tax=Acrasis kona TaxID=1008807 RepID=A0AAW2YKF9_9EUKA
MSSTTYPTIARDTPTNQTDKEESNEAKTIKKALDLLNQIQQSTQQFFTKVEWTFINPYPFHQAQADSKHISHMISQLEQLLDSTKLTFTLDHRFGDITSDMKDVIQQIKQETVDSKEYLSRVAKNASSVVEQVSRFDVLQYQDDDTTTKPAEE